MSVFEDRRDAGRQLVPELAEYRGTDGLVLALPRGGVVIGYEVATALELPLEAFVARKIGAPDNPELAIGAISEKGGRWMDQESVQLLGVPSDYLRQEMDRQRQEIDRRIQIYRQGRDLPSLAGRTVLLVDDGIATGYTMLAALRGIRSAGPRRLVVAVPVAPQEAVWRVSQECDQVICLATPEPFYAVGAHYVGFEQVSDEEVVRYLDQARQQVGARRHHQ